MRFIKLRNFVYERVFDPLQWLNEYLKNRNDFTIASEYG